MIRIDPARCRAEDLEPARAWLRAGGIVAFPTDTTYGLAVDPTSEAAVLNLFELKGRDPATAMPLIAGSIEQVRAAIGAITPNSDRLARAFWPGPLSLIFDAPAAIAPAVHGGRRTIAVRVPAHPVACGLAAAFGGLLTATSANRSGQPPASSVEALGTVGSDPRVLVIDAGTSPGGMPSTIVDARAAEPQLIREGAIAWIRVLDCLKG